MNKKIMVSLLTIIAMSALIVTGTYAYFSNSSSSTNNVFASGTLDLQLANGNTTFTDTVTATFGGGGLSPNSCLDPATLNMKNVGSVVANHIDISAINTNATFAAFLRLKILTLDGTDISLPDSNNNGYRDLQDLGTTGVVNKSVTYFLAHPLSVQVCLDGSAGNEQQGQSNTLNLTILMDQGPHS